MMVADQQERDFAPYDWNGDGTIEQVIVIFAGPSGNVSGQTGFLHPNTSSVSSVRTHDGKVISTYSSSAENWTAKGPNCGIGTICHEFTHCLGLPDIYQVSGASNIIVDEWDLMDGGNGTNYGWCPPNFSPLEKNLLGWLSYTELTEPATISDLKPVSEGGTAYQVKHTDSEYYLLENRQQSGWDAGLPGKGLVVWHVNYDAGRWRANTVNNYNELGFQLVHADGKDYLQSSSDVESKGLSHYASGGMMNSRYLSGSAYPFVEAGQANDSLTDQSEPASLMYQVNSSGSEYLGKAITHIQLSPSGLVSFDFMGGSPSAIRTLTTATRCEAPQYYDLSGRRLTAPTPGHLYIVRQCDGTVKVRR